MIISVLNIVFALITFGEVVYLIWRRFAILNCRSNVGWSCDNEFVTAYLLRKRGYVRFQRSRHARMDNDTIPICSIPDNNITDSNTSENIIADNDTPDCNITDSNTGENIIADSSLKESTDYYKEQLSNLSRNHGICYAQKSDLDELYIDVIIHTERAQHVFPKEMKRHEIFDVYMEVPESSTQLKKITDLFDRNQDTKWKFPRTILVVGRPGIGKTVLTEKIMRDWAKGIDKFYRDKIVFIYKFRSFTTDQFKNLSFKKFLRYGTCGIKLSEQKFESIFKAILNEPRKAIFIFDGLDEFNSDVKPSIEQSQTLPSDHDDEMSPMTLFIKLAYGNMLQGATVLVTSRPTAPDFYSKLSFERSIEIIGFTRAKIEEYVSRFCNNINRDDLKVKIWNHIQSSSDLLNLCYIPVSCFIVCVTLSGCLSDPRNDTGALPTTLTELYQTATDHFATHHNRNLDETSSEQMLEELQKLAFQGIERGQLVFNKKSFNELMKRSGLVNSLSNPVFPIQTQFCFIHLTIQEFLAARHMTETLTADKIEEFISTHIKDAKWHVVLQFVAGLIGQKIKMPDSYYQHGVSAFANHLRSQVGEIQLDDDNVFMMKCLREVDDEEIVKEVCKKTHLNLVTGITYSGLPKYSPSEWEAVTYVCKHLHNVVQVQVVLRCEFAEDVLPKIVKLLQQRCLRMLSFKTSGSEMTNDQLVSALMNSKCKLNHEHAELNHLHLRSNITDADVPAVGAFINNAHGSDLQKLILMENNITSCGISKLCEVLDDVTWRELTYLNLSRNAIGDEGVRMLCYALTQGDSKIAPKLRRLCLDGCSLTADGVRYFCDFLCHEDCTLSTLSLKDNAIGDEGVRTLCTHALKKEQCKLTELQLPGCHLTDECVPPLCEALQYRNCKLTPLSLASNEFTEEGKRLLRDVNETKNCKLKVED